MHTALLPFPRSLTFELARLSSATCPTKTTTPSGCAPIIFGSPPSRRAASLRQSSLRTHGYYQEFREFIAKGNAIDLAVGVIIGAAFGNIVKSMTEDVIMPPIGKMLGGLDGLNFKDY